MTKNGSQEFKQEFADHSTARSVSKWQSKVDGTMGFMDKIAPTPKGEDVNSGMVHRIGDAFAATGLRDFRNPNSPPIDADTMFPEASIGKVRYAGLGYMLEQDGILNMQDNAMTLFSEPGFKDFMEQKYSPIHGEGVGEYMQSQILKSFTGGSEVATLADLTTHYAGVGDLTRDQMLLFKEKGIEHNYDFRSLITPPEEARPAVLRTNGKPHAQSDHTVADKDLPEARYGTHQYSNLGYMMLAEAMEYSFAKKVKEDIGNENGIKPLEEGKTATYKDLMDAYMLHPTRGHAKGKGLDFKDTKFPEQIDYAKDNVVTTTYLDTKDTSKEVNANNFNGAYAAGGMFASANDSAKFFGEFFKGFPGTPEYGQDVNPFFTVDTIKQMEAEWKSRPADPKTVDAKEKYDGSYQGPGFVVRVKDGKVQNYDKGGGGFGCGSLMTFNPQEKTVDISMIARENLTVTHAKELGLHPLLVIDSYQKDGKFDRAAFRDDFNHNRFDTIKGRVENNPTTKILNELNGSELTEKSNIQPAQLMNAYTQNGKFDKEALLKDYQEKGVGEVKFKMDLDAITKEMAKAKGMANLRITDANEAKDTQKHTIPNQKSTDVRKL